MAGSKLNMKTNKITKILIVISLIIVVFNIARLDLWGTTNLLFLIWNLFLAWIPYIISSFFIKKDTSRNSFILFFIFWLLFFPNAPYLATDTMHLVSSLPASLLYDSLLLFFFGWTGLLLGTLSLFHIHQYLKNHLSHSAAEISVFIICFVSSFGVYLGRFERWNSWDIFINPAYLMKDSLDVLADFAKTGNSLLFVFVFTILMYSVYKTMYVLITDKTELS